MSKNTKKNSKKNIKKSKKQNIKKTKKISIRQKGGELDKTQESVQIEDKLFISRFLNTNRDKNIFNDRLDSLPEINNFLFQMYDKLDKQKLDKYYNSMKDKDVNTESNILNEIEIMKINNESKNTENSTENFIFPLKKGYFKQFLLDIKAKKIFLKKKDNNYKIVDDFNIDNITNDNDGNPLDNSVIITNIQNIITKFNNLFEIDDTKKLNPYLIHMFHQSMLKYNSNFIMLKTLNCKDTKSCDSSKNYIIIIDKDKEKFVISLINICPNTDVGDTKNPIYISNRSYITGDLYIQDDDNNFVENIINNNLFFGIDSSTQVPAANPSLAANPANPANPAANPAVPAVPAVPASTPLTQAELDDLKKQCNLIIVNILDKNIIEYCDSLKTVKP